jgi:hypothetical protein
MYGKMRPDVPSPDSGAWLSQITNNQPYFFPKRNTVKEEGDLVFKPPDGIIQLIIPMNFGMKYKMAKDEQQITILFNSL